MNAELREYDGCFEVEFHAETKEDVVRMARFSINKTKELRSTVILFGQDGEARGSIVIGKLKSPSSGGL